MNQKTRSARRWGLGAIVVFLATFGIIFAQNLDLSGDVQANGDTARTAVAVASQAQAQAQSAKQGVEEANRRLRAAGKPTVPVPTVSPLPHLPVRGEPGAASTIPGPQGPAPSAAQVQNAVATYCATRGLCKGPDGKAGPAGRNATPAQVAAAVASYCNARGECIGPTGKEGAAGERGPGPTDEQVASAVTVYCQEHDNCRGPQGVSGISIANMNCRDVEGDVGFRWEITFSDGSVDNDAGPCKGDQGESGTTFMSQLTCPDGQPPENVTVLTGEPANMGDPFPTKTILVCVVP